MEVYVGPAGSRTVCFPPKFKYRGANQSNYSITGSYWSGSPRHSLRRMRDEPRPNLDSRWEYRPQWEVDGFHVGAGVGGGSVGGGAGCMTTAGGVIVT